MKKIYFPNINGLRFLGALAVLFCHFYAWPLKVNQPSRAFSTFSMHLGQIALVLFFVLCSFLLTYLLLTEKERTGTINVMYFYIRRAYRIWPLYYLIIGLSFFVLPHFGIVATVAYPEMYVDNFALSVFFCLILLPNVTLFFLYPNIFAGPSWTIGVEEPFYFVWPWLIKKADNLLRMMVIFFLVCFITKIVLAFFAFYGSSKTMYGVYRLWNLASFTSFPMGGVMAWLYFNKKTAVLKVLYNVYLRSGLYLIAAAVLFSNIVFPFYFEFFSVAMAVLVLNMATNKKTMVNLDSCWLNYLGKVTYGVYLYHAIVIALAYKYLSWMDSVTLGITVHLAVVGIAILSYELMEKRFLKIKVKYMIVPSTDTKEKV